MSSVPLERRPSLLTTPHLRLGDKGLPPTRRCPGAQAALGRAGERGGGGPYAPFGQTDDVPRLDEAADLVPHGDGDAARLVRHFAGPHLVPILRLGDSPCGEKRGSGGPGGGRNGGAVPPAPRGTRVGGPGVGRAGRHLPISSTIKMTFKFFSPGFMSFMRWYVSLAALMLRPPRGAGRAEPASRGGAAAAAQGRAGGTGSPRRGRGHEHRGAAQ